MRRSLRRAGLALLVVIVAAPVLGAGAADSLTSPRPQHGPPPTMLGLNVKKEDISKLLATEKRPLYTDEVGLFSLREQSNLLQATMEISHFRNDQRWSSSDFQLSIVGRLGSSVPIQVRLGAKTVYLTSSKGLALAIWFDRQFMMTLSIRNSYKTPKELLRQALEVNP